MSSCRNTGTRRSFAKHIVAFAIKQAEGFTDEKLAEFLGKDPVGRLLGYAKRPNPSTFSKVRKRSDPKMFEELYNWLLQGAMKGKQVRLLVQDSTDVSAIDCGSDDFSFCAPPPQKFKSHLGRLL